MTRIQYFQYKAKKVTIDGITFDSKLEASMYKVLRSYKDLIDIRVHNKISTGWSIDFDLVPRSYNGVLLLDHLCISLYICNSVSGVVVRYPSRILLEIKGITDRNFVSRLNQIIGTNLDTILLLASDHCDAVGFMDPTPGSSRVLTKPIVPIKLIRDILAETR